MIKFMGTVCFNEKSNVIISVSNIEICEKYVNIKNKINTMEII